MATTARNRLQTDERRAQLLDLGLEIFTERSYDEVSIDEIARRAGISKGLLYHYFSNKREFYVAVVRHGAAAFDEAVRPDPELGPLERTHQGLNRYLDFVEDRASAYHALLSSGIGVDPEVAQIVDQCRRDIADRMLTDTGLDEPVPVLRTFARAWIGAVEHAALDWLEHRDISRDELVQLLAGMLMNGIQSMVEQDLLGDGIQIK